MAVITTLTNVYKEECLYWNAGQGGMATPLYIAFLDNTENGKWRVIDATLRETGDFYAKWRGITTNEGNYTWNIPLIYLVGITSRDNPGSQAELEYRLNNGENIEERKYRLVKTELSISDIIIVPPDASVTFVIKIDYNPA